MAVVYPLMSIYWVPKLAEGDVRKSMHRDFYIFRIRIVRMVARSLDILIRDVMLHHRGVMSSPCQSLKGREGLDTSYLAHPLPSQTTTMSLARRSLLMLSILWLVVTLTSARITITKGGSGSEQKEKTEAEHNSGEVTFYDTVQENFDRDLKTLSETLEKLETQGENFAKDVQNGLEHVQQDIQDGVEQVREEVYDRLERVRNDVSELGDSIYSEMADTSREMHKAIRRSRLRYKKYFDKTVFSQRVGWDRLRHSIRDYVGLMVGCAVVFRGYTNPHLAQGGGGGAIALQTSQLGWDLFHANNLLPHEPWLYDAAALALGFLTWKQQKHAPIIGKILPPFFLGFACFLGIGLALDGWNETESDGNFLFYNALLTALAFAVLKAGNIPIPLAASSISGALLVYESARAEIAGNWKYMLEMLWSVVFRGRALLIRAAHKVLWLRRLKTRLLQIVQPIKDGLDRSGEMVQPVLSFVYLRPMKRIRSYVLNHPLTIGAQTFAKRLRKAIRPILWPWGIAAWGVAVQMKYIKGVGGVWRFFRLTIDPVSFVTKRVLQHFSFKSWSKQSVLALARRVVALSAGKKKQQGTTTYVPPN
jgi:hypothetical protein